MLGMGPAQGAPTKCPTAGAGWVQHRLGVGQEVTPKGMPSVGPRVPVVTVLLSSRAGPTADALC